MSNDCNRGKQGPVSILRRVTVVALSFKASINLAWAFTLTLRKSGIIGFGVENTRIQKQICGEHHAATVQSDTTFRYAVSWRFTGRGRFFALGLGLGLGRRPWASRSAMRST